MCPCAHQSENIYFDEKIQPFTKRGTHQTQKQPDKKQNKNKNIQTKRQR